MKGFFKNETFHSWNFKWISILKTCKSNIKNKCLNKKMCQPQKIKIVASVIRNSQFESFYTKIPKSITLNTISGQLTLTAATGIWPLRCLLPFPGFGPLASRKFSMQHDSWRSGGRYGVHLQQRYDKRKLWKITFMVDRFEYFFICP